MSAHKAVGGDLQFGEVIVRAFTLADGTLVLPRGSAVQIVAGERFDKPNSSRNYELARVFAEGVRAVEAGFWAVSPNGYKLWVERLACLEDLAAHYVTAGYAGKLSEEHQENLRRAKSIHETFRVSPAAGWTLERRAQA